MFKRAFEDFFFCPWTFFKSLLLSPITIDQIFNATKKHFHENRLRTNPTTKQASKDDGKENNEDNTNNHQYGKKVHVLRPKNLTKDDEFTVNDVK